MDYAKMPYGKGALKDRKKKKLSNGWKHKDERYCFYCHTPGAERHEVYGGPNRQLSIQNGFQVDLCEKCHWEVTNNTERGLEIRKFWEGYFQRQYMDKMMAAGITEFEALMCWMSPEFVGRNYLEELEP